MFSTKSATPINRDNNKRLVKLIHLLLNQEESINFRKPVPHKALGLEDYRNIIKKPTDLNLIRRQNNDARYKTIEEALDEVQLCWDNCKMYNSPDSTIYQQAIFMETTFDKLGLELFPQIWETVDRKAQIASIEALAEEERRKLQLINSNKCPVKKNSKTHLEHPLELKKNKGEDDLDIVGSLNKNKSSHELSFEKEIKITDAIYSNSLLNNEPNSEENAKEGEEMVAEPIMVNLYETPNLTQLGQLSTHIRYLFEEKECGALEKVLEILHTHEKENMVISKSGEMMFQMECIHFSTYQRIRRAVGLPVQKYDIID